MSGRDDIPLKSQLEGRALMTTITSAGVLGGTNPGTAAPAPVWTPVPIPEQAPAHEAVAELPGTRLWDWDTGGSGRPVILMSPPTSRAAQWVYQQQVLAPAGYRAIGYSRR